MRKGMLDYLSFLEKENKMLKNELIIIRRECFLLKSKPKKSWWSKLLHP